VRCLRFLGYGLCFLGLFVQPEPRPSPTCSREDWPVAQATATVPTAPEATSGASRMDAPPLDSILDHAATPRAAAAQPRASNPTVSAPLDVPPPAAAGGGYWVTAFGYAKLELLPAVLVRASLATPTCALLTRARQCVPESLSYLTRPAARDCGWSQHRMS